MDTATIQESLVRVYDVLKFSPDEAKEALADLAGLQQLAVAGELIKSLSKDEVNELSQKIPAAGEAQKQESIKSLIEKRADNPAFKSQAAAAAKRVLDDCVAYLKTRGDDAQKTEIAKILAGIG